ncbi:hypothetical protein B0H16DRAFT_1461748 [Mycena metata]|uniref:Uncharacterized protein n=1 Tax=Mycena metata TaxID=1033252 RepID=A0AAD7ISI0_9AGAR|nr:hypothetical protein B0H16DRAFT_1461748 [Mycena metata]
MLRGWVVGSAAQISPHSLARHVVFRGRDYGVQGPSPNVSHTRRRLGLKQRILFSFKAPGHIERIEVDLHPGLNGSMPLLPMQGQNYASLNSILQYHSTSFRPSKRTVLTPVFEPNLQPFEFRYPTRPFIRYPQRTDAPPPALDRLNGCQPANSQPVTRAWNRSFK